MKGRLLKGLGVLVIAATGATVAWAVTGAETSTINACVAKNGQVSIYAPPKQCGNNETATSWNVQGPAGAPGAQGPTGAAGPVGPSAPSPDAIAGTITISGQHSGNFGDGLKITGYSHEIVSPRDAASGQATGKRQHKPITITKEIDKSTPLLQRAIYTNETLTSVLIGLLSPAGKVMATVKLTNASVSDVTHHGNTETISFTYQKITWTYVDGGITAEDDWQSPVA
jgi:type VI secretion system secreted protein Hcp